MQWKKRICIRIIARRITIAILIAASSVNLIIVGAAFEVASTTMPTPTSLSATNTLTAIFSNPTVTPWNTVHQLPALQKRSLLPAAPPLPLHQRVHPHRHRRVHSRVHPLRPGVYSDLIGLLTMFRAAIPSIPWRFRLASQ